METNVQETIQMNKEEYALYEKCILKHPGLTPKDFMELRGYALKTSSAGTKKFFGVNGVIIESKEDAYQIKHELN